MELLNFFFGTLAIWTGIRLLTRPRDIIEDQSKRFAELKDGATESYFEEKRALEFYAVRSPRQSQFFEVANIFIGVILIVSGFWYDTILKIVSGLL